MKKEIQVQNVGVDISKETFYAVFTVLLQDRSIKIKGAKKFANTNKGIQEFYRWINKFRDINKKLHITMEATGVYYEDLAFMMYEKEDVLVHVLLPNMAKKYFESLNIKTKTDKEDAKILGRMGVERELRVWTLSSKIYRELRVLTREREQIIKERSVIKNQLHALTHSATPHKKTIIRSKRRIAYLNKQEEAILNELHKMVEEDEMLSQKIKKITSTPGLGFKSVVGIIAETSGFVNITNAKQLTSYSGYDVMIRESGKWVGKPRISKKGNSHIRHLMYMPALTASVHNQSLKHTYDRIKEKKEYAKIASVALQRKLLILIYTLWKTDSYYIEGYESKKRKRDEDKK